jgi:hypothetical protein
LLGGFYVLAVKPGCLLVLVDLAVVGGHGLQSSMKLFEVVCSGDRSFGIVFGVAGYGCGEGQAVDHAIFSLALDCRANVAFVFDVERVVVTGNVA